ncbi:hypothetical protein PITCH_A980037 [uncultured Desulfobacterium sp.]|uniref:N-acyl amino acid synthase FeeM catalytic core domain-containing protein n=1 Tax=uncultured Desulfobacterium sp. TaxID=201089 RepID=A0A445N4B2_9BACT|nr:hypothetical protein PITCH_A980037 [uncultured Desulfobacterium sp.]
MRNNGGCAEVSRLSILPEFRGSLVSLAMFRAFYRYASARGIEYFCISVPYNHIPLYQNLGFMHFAGPYFNKLLGVNLSIYKVRIAEGLEKLRLRPPRMWDYFLQPLPGIG